MKNIFKFIMAFLIAGSSLFYSCETVELEVLENPNTLSPDQADPDLLLNSVQLAYLANMGSYNFNASVLTRIEQFFGRDYFNQLLNNDPLNATWSRTYSTANADTRGMIPNIQAIEQQNNAAGDGSLNYQEGVGKALLAHNLMLLVDFVGPIPFSQTNNPNEFPAPEVDPGAEVYAAALNLLSEAATLLNGASGTDLFYNTGGAIGSSDQWIKFINTVRLKAAITTGDLGTFDSIIGTGNFIATTADDFEYRYITNDVNPDGRHPEYIQDYTPSGANNYQSNWLMDTMLDRDDPRLRYYFYRQTDCTPGASCNPDPMGEAVTQLTCSIIAPPVHYSPDFDDQFCALEDGYWGRPHGDDQGTPPDSFFRTANGVYPAGGLFDDDRFGNVGLGLGGGGAGIEPFILASYVDFWRAERAMTAGNAMAASGFLEDAISKSVTKVLSFGSLDPTADATFFVDSATADAFVASVVADFDAASGDDKMNILAEQNWIAQFGGGAETYNFYRRTGFPTTLTPNIEPNPGRFPRSFPYASGEVTANPNLSQKPDLNLQVFWDNNPPSAPSGGFPASN